VLPTAHWPGVLILVSLFAATAIACSDADTDTPAGPTGTVESGLPPESAIGFWVQNRLNQGFVPDCEDASRPEDVGKQCARYLKTRTVGPTEYVAYGLGPVFQYPTRIFILTRAENGWSLVRLQELDPGAPVPGMPWPIAVGADLVVVGTGDCLNVRERPGVGAPEVECLPDGTEVKVAAGPVEIDGIEWWQLEVWNGWSSSDYLRYPDDLEEQSGG
jgi:hypothetical protein